MSEGGRMVGIATEEMHASASRPRLYQDGQRPIGMCAELGYRAFSILALPGGRTLIGGHSNGQIGIHHPSDGRLEGTMAGHTGAVLAMTVANDSIFTAGIDRTVRQWSLVDFGFVREMIGHTGMVLALCSAPSTRHCGLFSAGDDDEIYQWRWDTGELVWSFKGHDSPINCLAATTTLLFAGCSEGKIYVHSLGLKRRLLSVVDARSEGAVWTMACSSDGTMLLTAGQDGLLRMWAHKGEETEDPCTFVSAFPRVTAAVGDEDRANRPGVVDAASSASSSTNGENGGAAASKGGGAKYAWGSSNVTIRSVAIFDETVFAGTSEGTVVVYDIGDHQCPEYLETLVATFADTTPHNDLGQAPEKAHNRGGAATASPKTSGFFSAIERVVTSVVVGVTHALHSPPTNPLTAHDDTPSDAAGGNGKTLVESVQGASPFAGEHGGKNGGEDDDPAVVQDDDFDAVTKTLSSRITALGLQNNELFAVGLDGYLVKWNVLDQLTENQEMVPLPPLFLMDGDDAQQKASPQEMHQRMLLLDASKAAIRYKHLPINYIINALRTKVQGAWLSNEAFLYIPFVIMFLFFVVAEVDIYQVYLMNKGVADSLERQPIGDFRLPRQYADITGSPWWGKFVNRVFIPKLWSSRTKEAGRNEALSIAGQNEVIGSVRFRTQRASGQSCGSTSTYRNRFSNVTHPNYTYSFARTLRNVTQMCYGNLGEVTQRNHDKNPFACAYTSSHCQHDPFSMRVILNQSNGLFNYDGTAGYLLRATIFYASGGHTIEIPTYLSQADAADMAKAIYDNGFVDDVATRLVTIEFFHYNPALDIYINHKYICEVFAGGYWLPRATHTPFKVFTFAGNTFRVVYEIVFFVFVLFWMYVYFANMYRYKQTFGNVLGYILDVWTLMDIVNTCFFIATFYFRWEWYTQSLRYKVQRPFQTEKFPETLAIIEDAYTYTIYVNSVNTVLTLLKVMKYAQLSDKLNLLTRALSKAQSAIVGVLFLFIYFVMAFALAGTAMYGENVFVFRTLDTSYNTLLRWLVGDVDYDSLSEVTRTATPVFFWTYRIVAQFVLLSLLIAVLADAFDEAVADRLPIPLDTAILRVAGDMRKFFLPQYFRVTMLLLLRRSSRTSVIAKQLRLFLDHRDSILSEEARLANDFDELDDTYVTKAFFSTEMAPDIVRKASERRRSSAAAARRDDDSVHDDGADDEDDASAGKEDLNFLDEVWYDLAYEYHWQLQDAFHQKQHELKSVVDDVAAGQLAFLKLHIAKYEKAAKELSKVLSAVKATTAAGSSSLENISASLDISPVKRRGSMGPGLHLRRKQQVATSATMLRGSGGSKSPQSTSRLVGSDHHDAVHEAVLSSGVDMHRNSSVAENLVHTFTTTVENARAELTGGAAP